MTAELCSNNVLVELNAVNGETKPVTTSMKVAMYFGKEHKHVMRDIRETLSKCSESFNGSNFGLVDYTDPKGEKRPMYLLTRDGFTMVAMGYTGRKAMEFKEAYINAFNAMEQELKNRHAAKAHTVSTSQQKSLDEMKAAVGLAMYALDKLGCSEAEKIEKLDLVFKELVGLPILKLAGYGTKYDSSRLYTASQLGFLTNTYYPARRVNKTLSKLGYLQKDAFGKWELTKKGEDSGGKTTKVFVNRKQGGFYRSIAWPGSFVDIIRATIAVG